MTRITFRFAPALLALLTVGTTVMASRSFGDANSSLASSVSEEEGAAILGGTTSCPTYLSTTTGCGFVNTTQACQNADMFYSGASGSWGTLATVQVTCKSGSAVCGTLTLPASLSPGCSGS